jgi:hypothetical protein
MAFPLRSRTEKTNFTSPCRVGASQHTACATDQFLSCLRRVARRTRPCLWMSVYGVGLLLPSRVGPRGNHRTTITPRGGLNRHLTRVSVEKAPVLTELGALRACSAPRCSAMSKRSRCKCRAPAVRGWTVFGSTGLAAGHQRARPTGPTGTEGGRPRRSRRVVR